MTFKNIISITVIALCLLPTTSFAQTDDAAQAKMYYDLGTYNKAAQAYEELYNKNKNDRDIYDAYLDALLKTEDYKKAEKTVEEQLKRAPGSPVLLIDLGRIYKLTKKEKKAEELFEKAIKTQNGADMLTQHIAKKFESIGMDKLALRTYEYATELTSNRFQYSGPMSQLYYKTGDLEKAIYSLLDASRGFYNRGVEEVKTTLLEYLGDDRKKIVTAQKALIKKINEKPDNPYYSELLTWVYTQKGDWEGALIQVRALDERFKEQGERLLEFARYAVKEKEYDFALQAYNEALTHNRDYPFYASVVAEKLSVSFNIIQDNPQFTKAEVETLAGQYQNFLDSFPVYYITQAVRDYSTLEAQYNNNVDKGITLLEKAINTPQASKQFIGEAKLQLGDYYIIAERIWDASLIYSQVDKAFREDVLGEEARFRNAKLAYYRSDFDWANGQLTVLKASTSELIANDALYLSILLTENVPSDSNYIPLERYAHADLLLFQNKDDEAEKLLDSIANAFPSHPLQDDILMMRADIAVKHKDYKAALEHLERVYVGHKDDVLADKALFTMAEIKEQNLNDKEEAGKLYAQLILEYPGSTYVQLARKKVKELDAEVNL